jgi:hypothetical protein
MAFPLIMLGAALSALAVNELAEDRVDKLRKRRRMNKVETLSHKGRHDSPVAFYPSDLLVSMTKGKTVKVAPEVGSIVCCGLGGVLDHTGIYIGDNTIVELSGNGLVKAVSMQRFLFERSGKHIYIACDSNAEPLINDLVAQKASEQIFNYYEYDVIKNNCHRFIWQCFEQGNSELTTFKALSHKIARYYNRVIYWDLCQFNE